MDYHTGMMIQMKIKKKMKTLWEIAQRIATKKSILYIGGIIGVATYLFWKELKSLGISIFYVGNAAFIFSLCLYLFLKDTKSFIKYVLFCLSLNNLLDELIFDNTQMGVNELFILLAVLIFAIIRNKNAKRP